MTSGSELSHQIDSYHDWKRHLTVEIERYLLWLKNNNLCSEDVEEHLNRGLNLLHEDQLTIAMVGEYSRGKTELINALLFSEFGQRMLPSQAGRTTMCPTEIFYDHQRAESYLQLLPIETRIQNLSIGDLKHDATAWREVLIDNRDPEQMSHVLQQVAATRTATLLEAKSLGFDENMLEFAPGDNSRVIIPVWRHAMLSLDNPMLRKGLRILDTPGLNALGSEPELTISMVPKAQAIIFLLSADAGVTASDLAIWKRFIQTKEADHRAGRFAVLNKIDVLWDDLQGEEHTATSIEKVRQSTADCLGIALEDVIPLSAKQGLMGRVKKDDKLLQKSDLPNLERLISQEVLAEKERLIFDELIDDVSQMLHRSQAVLNERLAALYDRHDALADATHSQELLKGLAEKTHQDHDFYNKRLITLKSSRRLMKSQGDILAQLIGDERFDGILKKTEHDLHDSWSTVGMTHAMNQFFVKMEAELAKISYEAKMADKMVLSIYQRFKSDIDADHLKPRTFNISMQKEDLKLLKRKLIQFCRRPKMFITEQSILVTHFFDTFVAEVRMIQEQVVKEAQSWPEESLFPLIQYTLEQKNMLEEQVANLKQMASSSREANEQQSKLQQDIDHTHELLNEAEGIQEQLSSPAPTQQAQIQDIAIR